MANQPTITRRAAFATIGALASTAALAVPAVAAITNEDPRDPLDRLNGLVDQLSDTLAEIYGDQFRAVVEPSPEGGFYLMNRRNDLPEDVLSRVRKFQEAHREFVRLSRIDLQNQLPPWRRHEPSPAAEAAIKARQRRDGARESMIHALLTI